MAEAWATEWVAKNLRTDHEIAAVDIIADGNLLEIKRNGYAPFKAAAIGVRDIVNVAHVEPLFVLLESPDFVINVPSTAIWIGPAIDLIHKAPAAFGGMGDLVRASREEQVSSYRYRNYQFVEDGLLQHSAVQEINRVYDRVFRVVRDGLPSLTVVLIDAYHMSAEDLRRARKRYGQFDVALKTTSYGGITSSAEIAADSMGAGVFMWGDLLRKLRKP